jgi:AcrR family transcriptional regulator
MLPTPETRAPRTQSRSIATRRKIVRAAERRFSPAGYEATSMNDVASASGIAIGSVYYHFADERTPLLALMDDLLERLSKVRGVEVADSGAVLGSFSKLCCRYLLEDRQP